MTDSLIKKLFELISISDDNEDEILSLLEKSKDMNLKTIVNFVDYGNPYRESMLMWAVWTLKEKVVKKLVEIGANVSYSTMTGESVVTYWDKSLIEKSNQNLIKACDIASFLHKHGARLNKNGDMSWSIVKRARKYEWALLMNLFVELGY